MTIFIQFKRKHLKQPAVEPPISISILECCVDQMIRLNAEPNGGKLYEFIQVCI